MASTGLSPLAIVRFDVRSEEFNMFQAPHHVGKLVGFIEYGGKPAIIDHTHLICKGLVDLWLFEYTGKWSRKSLVLQPYCQMHFLLDNNIHLTVEGTTQNGEVIFALPPFLHFLL